MSIAFDKASAAIVDLRRQMDELLALRRAVYCLNALRNGSSGSRRRGLSRATCQSVRTSVPPMAIRTRILGGS